MSSKRQYINGAVTV